MPEVMSFETTLCSRTQAVKTKTTSIPMTRGGNWFDLMPPIFCE